MRSEALLYIWHHTLFFKCCVKLLCENQASECHGCTYGQKELRPLLQNSEQKNKHSLDLTKETGGNTKDITHPTDSIM